MSFFIGRIESLSSRFLTERSHELIVVPAIADMQHDANSETLVSAARARASVLAAFGGALYDELTADASLLKIAALILIPASYYTFLIYLCQPQAALYVQAQFGRLVLPAAIALLSIPPVLVCCWPERTRRRTLQPDALRRCSGQAADA
jgi:hypothetical protein